MKMSAPEAGLALLELLKALAAQNLRDIAETSYPANVEPAATERATPKPNLKRYPNA